MSIFQEIKKAVTAALLDGESAGEKLLLADGELVWSSGEGFLYSHLDSLKEASETGVQEIAGKQVYFDCVSSQKKLVICGAGHVSMPIIALGKMLGFRVTVLEDRPSFADNARRAGADEVICENFVDGLSHAEGGTDSYFVVVTRGHRYDEICLGEILKKKYVYVGMMGSRARSAIVKRNLVELGFPKEQVEAVHTPIGLDISAESPEEIAVSIMGEIIAHKNSRKRSFGYPDEFLDELLKLEEEGTDAVLCTIVRRRGSAPREVGTKMIVRTDGQMIGTIGGGCMEAAVRTRALHMLRSGETQPQICNVNMTAADAEDEGMVCGGNIDVWLEVLR